MITPDAFQAWLNTAPPGDRIAWHVGFLARERKAWTEKHGHGPGITRTPIVGLDKLAKVVAAAAESGAVVLTQKRVGRDRWEYRAIKSTPVARVVPEAARAGSAYSSRNRGVVWHGRIAA
jgi:hypothetical protein